MSPLLGRVADRVRSREPEEVVFILVCLVASVCMGVPLMLDDAALAPTDDDRSFVVVVTGQGPAEGLIAGSLGDAVLSLPRAALPGTLTEDVQRMSPTSLVILGGEDVVTAATAATLAGATTAPVTRLAGPDRYETAAQAAMSMFEAPVREVLIAVSGATLESERTIGPPADRVPVLLVTPNRVPPSTTRALEHLRPKKVTVVGGAGAMSDAVTRQVQQHATDQLTNVAAP